MRRESCSLYFILTCAWMHKKFFVCVCYQLKIINKNSQCIEWPMKHDVCTNCPKQNYKNNTTWTSYGTWWYSVHLKLNYGGYNKVIAMYPTYKINTKMYSVLYIKYDGYSQIISMNPTKKININLYGVLDNGGYSQITWILCIQLTKST